MGEEEGVEEEREEGGEGGEGEEGEEGEDGAKSLAPITLWKKDVGGDEGDGGC